MIDKITKTLLSLFGIGYFPKFPGTIASIASLPLIYFFNSKIESLPLKFAILLLLTIMMSLLAERLQRKLKIKDPSWIVIDEFLGLMTVCLIIQANSYISYILALIFFRIFDIFKPWPVSYVDKINHGAATICDDIVAGLYSAGIILLLNYFKILS